MKQKSLIIITAAVLLMSSSCRKSFNDLYQNNNKPASVPPSLILTSVLNSMADMPAGQIERTDQYFLINYDYYGNNRYDFGAGDDYYITLENVNKMQEEALNLKLPEVNPYGALARFLQAYYYTKMSLEVGDIPLTDALKGSENLTPAYTSQKDVFKQAFLWLDTANSYMGQVVAEGTQSMTGDIYYGNDLAKWQKAINSFRIRLLLELSKKADDADLNVKGQFAMILANPATYPIMESSDDNLQYTFIFPTNEYPENPGSFGFNALRENTSATYVGLLTSLKDPRTFVTSEPSATKVKNGAAPDDFAAFLGADPGQDLGVMYVKANAGDYSLINRHYFYQTYVGEPSIQIGFPELCFNIAEGINRGWATTGGKGSAEANYKAGILASWESYGIPETGAFTQYVFRSGSPSPGPTAQYDTYSIPVNFTTYYAQPKIAYVAGATGLTEILEQKYLALFRHSGLEAYYTYRRTGVPTFTTGAGTGNGSRIALRYQYPASEKSANTVNYNAALAGQYGGNDDINGKMWLLQ